MPARRSLPLAALLTTLVAAAPAAPASAAEVGGFGARPAPTRHAQGRPLGAYFKLRIHVRHLLRRQAIVSNSTGHPVTLRVDAVDGVTGATSGSVYADRGRAPQETGRWVRPDVRQITLAPHTSRRVTFTARVPYGASPGNHLAGLAFQDVRARRGRGRFAVRQVVRVVVGVEITVPGAAHYGLALPRLGLRALGGTAMPAVVVRTQNRGRRLCKPNLTVTVARRGGGTRRTVHRRIDTVLPGDTIDYPLPWPHQLADGAYTVDALATGCGRRATQHAVVRLGAALRGTASRPGVLLPAAPASRGPAPTPWWMFAMVGIAGVLAGVAVGRGRGRRRPPRVAA